MRFREWLIKEAKIPMGQGQEAIKRASLHLYNLMQQAPKGPIGWHPPEEMEQIKKDFLALHEEIIENIKLIAMMASEETGEVPEILESMLEWFVGRDWQDLWKHYHYFHMSDYFKAIPHEWARHGLVQIRAYRPHSDKLPVMFISSYLPSSWFGIQNDRLLLTQSFIHFNQEFIDGMFHHHLSAWEYIKRLRSTVGIADWDEVTVYATSDEIRGRHPIPTNSAVLSSPGIPQHHFVSSYEGDYEFWHMGKEIVPDERGLFMYPNVEQSDALQIPPRVMTWLRSKVDGANFTIVNDYNT